MTLPAEAVPAPARIAHPLPALILLLSYMATLLLSAALLFLVQPMISKMALPQLGGSPSVWNTCLFFFQAVLLLGYAYSHGLTRWVGRRGQVVIHLALLAIVALFLPLSFGGDAPPIAVPPVLWLLGRLALTVGLPFFAISATAPLLQSWFSRFDHPAARDPYFLYAASNVGSLLALLSYPLLVEPALPLALQSRLWSVGFAALAVAMMLCAIVYLLRGAERGPAAAAPASAAMHAASTATGWQRLRWVALAFVPSSLLLGVTAHITTDIGSAPLFWVVPLALYLLTFALAFAARPPLRHEWMVRLQPLLVIPLVVAISSVLLPIFVTMAFNLAAFFVIAMVCHGELARSRPEVSRLTEFYLLVSLGGVLGGLFNTLIAPLLFPDVWEYPLLLALSCLARPALSEGGRDARWKDVAYPALFFLVLLLAFHFRLVPMSTRITGLGALAFVLPGLVLLNFSARPLRFALGLAAWMLVPGLLSLQSSLLTARSFFGVYRVSVDEKEGITVLTHGTTIHGAESRRPGEETFELSYYSKEGAYGRFFQATAGRRIERVAVLGLGAGALACYSRPGQSWAFYEIDPLVERIARDERFFHYLSRCGNHPRVVLGDARLMLGDAVDGGYDLLVLDVFSSDNVPMHLLTREALALYFRKLAPDGILILHVSNRYLDLAPVVTALAADAGAPLRHMLYRPPPDAIPLRHMGTELLVMGKPGADLSFLTADAGWDIPPPAPATALWTDQRSDILRSIRGF
jgi:SAM-dependent methyltransferase